MLHSSQATFPIWYYITQALGGHRSNSAEHHARVQKLKATRGAMAGVEVCARACVRALS